MADPQPPQHKWHLNGEYMAAILGAAIGLVALGIAVLGSELSPSFKAAMQALGSWIPHADHIGPYSGKETVLLLAWLGSWLLLHLSLRRRTVDPRPWFFAALLLLLAAVVLVWPPTWHALGA